MRRNGKAVTNPDDFARLFLAAQQGPHAQAAPQPGGEQRVVVEIRGLDNITVTGAGTSQASDIRRGVGLIVGAAQHAAAPPNHRGV